MIEVGHTEEHPKPARFRALLRWQPKRAKRGNFLSRPYEGPPEDYVLCAGSLRVDPLSWHAATGDFQNFARAQLIKAGPWR
jgi:hypothetical protein